MRFTEKYDINYKHKQISKEELDNMYGCLKEKNYLAQIFWKLGKLEDIEEEIGFDLDILFKALKNGIYVISYDEKVIFKEPQHLSIGLEGLVYSYNDYYRECYESYVCLYEEFGKTWALTKEELPCD